MEVIISIAIIAIISVIGSEIFVSISNNKSLDADVSRLISAIEKARSLSIAGGGGSEHGVAVASSSVIVFQGTSINSGTYEATYNFTKGTVSSLNFSNGTTSFYFNKITGKPSATGTIIMSASNSSTTITIFASGLIE